MRQIILIILFFLTTLIKGQEFDKFYFLPNIIHNGDTIKQYRNFYLTTNSDTIFPEIKKQYFKLKVKDSIVDFHLSYMNRILFFKSVETFRLMKNSLWQIHINDNASDSSYEIIIHYEGLDLIVGGKNIFVEELRNGELGIAPAETNKIYLTGCHRSRRKFRKNYR